MSQIKSSEQTSWPELVGLSGVACQSRLYPLTQWTALSKPLCQCNVPAKEAEDKLRFQHKNLTIQVLPEDAMVTMDYREDRVRIFTNKEGKVARPPMIG